MLERPCEIAAIGAREKQGNRGVPGKNQLQNVNVAVISEQASEIGENAPGGRVVHVMKETVDEDEIEALVGRSDVGGSIMGFEAQVGVGRAISTFGIANVFGVEVDAEIIGTSELSSICAGTAANVEDAANALHVVVGGDRSKFPFAKRRHPEPVDQRLAHDQIQCTHIPHSNQQNF